MEVGEAGLNQIKGLLHYLNESFDSGDLVITGLTLSDRETDQVVGVISVTTEEVPYAFSINTWT